MKKKVIVLLPYIIVLSFAFLAGFPLLKSGLPPTHDGEYHIIRFYEFDKVLRDGNIYPRFAPDLNNKMGVPLFNYVYPLPNYAASFLHFFGVSFINAFKYQMFIASLAGGIFFYLFTKKIWGVLGGITGSVFYTFSPYHFVDIYVRGSVGEVWALAFFPAFLWSITIFIKEKNIFYGLFSSIFLALLIFSHNILGLMFFMFAIFYVAFLIFQSKDKKNLILSTLSLILIGLGLSSIFWIPALLESKYVTGLQIYNVKDNFPELYQLIFPSWGTGFSSSDLSNQISFQIGIANLIAVFFSFFVAVKLAFKKDRRLYFVMFFLISFFFTLFLLLKKSIFIWEAVPFMNYFQFPWRLLSLLILISSFISASIFSIIKSKIFACLLIFLGVSLTIGYTKPAYYHQREDNYYTTKSNFIDGTNSVGNYFNTIWFNNKLKKQGKLELEKNEIILEQITSQNYKFILSLDKAKSVTLNTVYFPGWTVFINGEKRKISNTKDGRISFSVSAGKSIVELRFLDTATRNTAKFISILSLFILLALFFKNSNRFILKKLYVRIKR